MDESRIYPFENENNERFYPFEAEEKETAQPASSDIVKGKGKRGGNSQHSIVKHSGNFKAKPEKKSDNSERKPFDRKDRKDSRPFDRSGRSEDRDGRFGRRDNRKQGGSFRDRNFREEPKRFTGGSSFSVAYTLPIASTSEIGAFVEAPKALKEYMQEHGSKSDKVLIPFAEQIGRPRIGDEVTVRFYEDKGGRLAATMREPILKDGEVGILTVADVTSIGVFLDNGVPKQVLVPFKEQIVKPEKGDKVLVWMYTDKSGRQAASMRVYRHLDKNSPYKEDDRVSGFVYEINPDLGIFLAVDNKYYGMIPIRESFKEYEYGDVIEARVAKVREDGKLDLLVREKLYISVQEDADVILYELKKNNGFLPYGDRADADFIEETYAMSKNQFKRALGHLYKNRIVELDREKDTITLIKK